jgi:peptide deformylase
MDMKKIKLVHYPNPILRRRAKQVLEISDEVKIVAARMLQIMHEAPGVGLAAPQVGLDWRLIVTCHSGERSDDRVFVNPVLRDPSKEMEEADEGCLSLPGINSPIRRPRVITMEAMDLDGQPICMTRDDLLARIWQHECDHLDGVLILDRMAPIDKMANRQAIRELEEDYNS